MMDESQNLEKEGQEAAQQVLQPEKKANRRPLMILAIIILLGLVGYGVYAWQNNRVAQESSKQVEVKKVAVIQLKPEDVNAKIKSELAKQYAVLDAEKNNQPATGQVSIRSDKASPSYKVAGYMFYTDYSGGSSIYVVTAPGAKYEPIKQTDKQVRQQIIDTYTSLGLKKIASRGAVSDGTASSDYEGKGVICVAYDVDNSSSDSSSICGLISAYPKSAATAKPLYEALPDKSDTTILSNVRIADSLVSGYQHAGAGIGYVHAFGGAYALFYKKGNNSWVYFKSTQEAIPCSDYSTADLRNAFKGEKCYDAATNSSDALVK